MEFIKVKKQLNEYKQIKKLYETAFPKEERAPFRVLMKKNGISQFYSIYDGDWVGMIHMMVYKEIAYIFYLAICEDKRNLGYGKKTIQKITEMYKDKIVFLALESMDPTADNYQQRLNRHAFYESCGLKDQPYKIKESSVIYDMMGNGLPCAKSYYDMMDIYMGKLLHRMIDMRIIEETL